MRQTTGTVLHYLDRNGKWDPRKSEARRILIKSQLKEKEKQRNREGFLKGIIKHY